MASLWSLIPKKAGCTCEDLREPFLQITQRLSQFSPHLVNVNDIVQKIQSEELGPLDAGDFTPCHSSLWLEWFNNLERDREAILIFRTPRAQVSPSDRLPETAAHLLEIALWREAQGKAVLCSDVHLFIDKNGQGTDDRLWYKGRPTDEEAMWWRLRVAEELMSIMNTRGTRIEPPLDKPPAEVLKPNRAPHSVWHTIHLPQFKAPPLENAVIDGPVLERREHWVRAHRKDYRDGKGLFGRVKALVWVPEHQRGNPELGTVKQSFVVHKKPEA